MPGSVYKPASIATGLFMEELDLPVTSGNPWNKQQRTRVPTFEEYIV